MREFNSVSAPSLGNIDLARAVLDSAEDSAVFALDTEYRYLIFNECHRRFIENIWGVTPRIEMNMLEEVIFDPDDRRKAQFNFDRALNGESFTITESYGDEIHYERRWYDNSYSPLYSPDTGAIIGVTVVIMDVTRRVQAEAALQDSELFLRSTLDGMGAHIAVLDEQGEIVLVNKAWRNVAEESGIPADRVSEGVNYLSVCYNAKGEDAEEAKEFAKGIMEVISGDRELFKMEYSCSTTQRELWSIARVTPFPEAPPRRVVVVHLDITERKKLEQLKEDVDRVVRHDLKTPLNGIMGLSDFLLNDENLNEEQRELLRTIQGAGQRMLDIISMSLSLYDMEKGEYDLNPVPVDLVPIIREIKNDLGSHLKRLNCKLHLSILTEQENYDSFFVLGETLLCYTMLSNLIKNAVESIEYGEAVHVYLERTSSSQAKISIHNPGVIPEKIHKSFGQKYTTLGKKSGTGLGVYSARLIANAMNGSFDWSTSRENGTYVYLYLPSPEET